MKIILIQICIGIILFLLIWILLKIIAAKIIDPGRVAIWIGNKCCLKLIKPEFQDRVESIIKRYFRLALSLFLVLIFFQSLRTPAEIFSTKFLPEPPSFLYTPKRSQNWLDDLPLIGREKHLAGLNKFLHHESNFSWWWMSGNPGSDKSRIALEWVLSLPKHDYDAGFFLGTVEKDFWKKWLPRRSTVIVIDDAVEYVDNILHVLKLLGIKIHQMKYPVRVLLVGRTLPMSLKKLEEDQVYVAHQYKDSPLIVSPLQKAHLRTLAEQLSTRRNKKLVLTTEMEDRIMKITEGLRLLMILALDSLLEDGTLRWSDHMELLTNHAERLAIKLQKDGLEECCMPLLALATFMRGLPWDAAKSFSAYPECHNKRLLDRLFNQDTAKAIPPIKPDLVGEYFLLQQFNYLNEPQRNKFLDIAWNTSPSTLWVTLLNLIQDAPMGQPLVEALDKCPDDEEAKFFWGKARVNLLSDEVDLSFKQKKYRWNQLVNLAHNHPNNEKMNENLALGASSIINVFGDHKKLKEVNETLEHLNYIETQFPKNANIAAGYAGVLVNAIRIFGQNQEFDKALIIFNTLKRLLYNRKEDLEIQICYVTGAANIINCVYSLSVWNEMENILIKIDELSSANPDHILLQTVTSGALGNAIRQYIKQQNLEKAEIYLKKINDIAVRFPKNYKIQFEHTKILSDLVFAYGQKQNFAKMKEMYQRSIELSEHFPDSANIQLQLARSAASAIGSFRSAKRLNDMLRGLQKLIGLAKRFPDHEGIHIQFARGATNALDRLGRDLSPVNVSSIFEAMQESSKRFPGQFEINSGLAVACVRIIGFYSNKACFEDMKKAMEFLIGIGANYKNIPEIQRNLAIGLLNAIGGYGENNRLCEMQMVFDRLIEIGEKYPEDEEIQSQLALGASNALSSYGDKGRLVDMLRIFDFLEVLAETHPGNPKIQVSLATAVSNVIGCFGKIGRLEDMKKKFVYLKKLAAKYPKNGIIELALAAGTYNTLNFFGKNGRLKDMQHVFNFLKAFAAINPKNLGIQLTLAIGAIVAIESYVKKEYLAEAKDAFKVLTRIAEAFPKNPKIQKLIIRGEKIIQQMVKSDETKNFNTIINSQAKK